MNKAIPVLGTAVLALATAGCASTLIGDDVIADRTASALGMNKSDFTIGSRSDDR